MAVWIRRCASAVCTCSPNRSESRRKSSAGARVIALMRSLMGTWRSGGRAPSRRAPNDPRPPFRLPSARVRAVCWSWLSRRPEEVWRDGTSGPARAQSNGVLDPCDALVQQRPGRQHGGRRARLLPPRRGRRVSVARHEQQRALTPATPIPRRGPRDPVACPHHPLRTAAGLLDQVMGGARTESRTERPRGHSRARSPPRDHGGCALHLPDAALAAVLRRLVRRGAERQVRARRPAMRAARPRGSA